MSKDLTIVYLIIGTMKDGASTLLKAFLSEQKAIMYLDKITRVEYINCTCPVSETSNRVSSTCEVLGITAHMEMRIVED